MRPVLPLLLVPAFLAAQVPRIAIIDFYGLRKTSEGKARKALRVREGDPLPGSKAEVEERLEKLPNVVRARLEAVCCEQGNAILFVGIEEKGALHFDYHPAPSGDAVLSEEIYHTYDRFLSAFETAVRIGDTREDLSEGHALSANSQVRAIQEQFVDLADKHFETLRAALRNSADERTRAVAAHVIAYASNKKLAAGDLQHAMQDPNDAVRNNAMRGLVGIATLAGRDPELGIRIEPTWFIEMLNSLVWTDRNKASAALAELTEGRDPKILERLRERALPSLVEMGRWKSLGHALPAFLLVGRLAGLPENEIESAWSRGDREAVIGKLAGGKRR